MEDTLGGEGNNRVSLGCFDNLVDVTEPICQAINSAKADMTIFDSSGIEAFVTENNPKYANRIIKP